MTRCDAKNRSEWCHRGSGARKSKNLRLVAPGRSAPNVNNPSKNLVLDARNHFRVLTSSQSIPNINTIMFWHIVMQKSGWNDVIWVLASKTRFFEGLFTSGKIWCRSPVAGDHPDFHVFELPRSTETIPNGFFHYKVSEHNSIVNSNAFGRSLARYVGPGIGKSIFRWIVHMTSLDKVCHAWRHFLLVFGARNRAS